MIIPNCGPFALHHHKWASSGVLILRHLGEMQPEVVTNGLANLGPFIPGRNFCRHCSRSHAPILSLWSRLVHRSLTDGCPNIHLFFTIRLLRGVIRRAEVLFGPMDHIFRSPKWLSSPKAQGKAHRSAIRPPRQWANALLHTRG